MRITIEDINNSIKNVLKDSEVLASESLYEVVKGNEDIMKLVIPMNKLYTDDEFNIIYTKFIFVVDSGKTHLVKNNFLYLYDINTEYNNIIFESIEEFEEKLGSIFKNKKFGKDIKILSEFIKHPATSLNNWIYKYVEKDEMSFLNVEFIPNSSTEKNITFRFDLSLSNVGGIKLSITKEKDNLYKYNFNFENNQITIERRSLNDLIATIAQTIKNNVK